MRAWKGQGESRLRDVKAVETHWKKNRGRSMDWKHERRGPHPVPPASPAPSQPASQPYCRRHAWNTVLTGYVGSGASPARRTSVRHSRGGSTAGMGRGRWVGGSPRKERERKKKGRGVGVFARCVALDWNAEDCPERKPMKERKAGPVSCTAYLPVCHIIHTRSSSSTKIHFRTPSYLQECNL